MEEHGLLENVPDWIAKTGLVNKPYDPDNIWGDELIMYLFFAGGFIYQFPKLLIPGVLPDIPFPINLILLPVSILEAVLKWQ
eukprot:3515248-Prymnesium_polylepis.1